MKHLYRTNRNGDPGNLPGVWGELVENSQIKHTYRVLSLASVFVTFGAMPKVKKKKDLFTTTKHDETRISSKKTWTAIFWDDTRIFR